MQTVASQEIRMIQVAVDSRYQGEGIGREMVKYAEKRAREAGYSRLVMHAMLSVVNFYEKMGYRQEGEIFEDQGITFARMVKNLNWYTNFIQKRCLLRKYKLW